MASCTDGTAKLGYLYTNSYAGTLKAQVEIIGETPKRYRIRALSRTRLAGKCRWIYRGETALVPKDAVQITPGALYAD